ncbi:MAG: sulfatase-like hydrolase/transferase [Acidobacteria bacterium]|nr:sulfatase-like hydrolase/transferase [Acidobacteriota bacterium]
MIDWYDKQACHLRTPEIWDRTNGRVYNVKYRGVESRESRVESQRKATDLTRLSDAELVKLHAHPNEWHVRMARRILQERAEAVRHAPPNAGISATQAQTPGLLMDFFRQTPDVTHKLRALWTLHAMFGVLGEDRHEILSVSGPDSETIRAWLIQLDSEQRDVPGTAWKGFVEMANSADEPPLVRLALASALQRMRLDERWKIAAGLLSHAEDADDHNLPLMYWYGIEPLVAADPAKAMLLAKASKIEKVSRFIVRRAASTNETTNAAVEWLASATDVATQQMLLDEMRLALEGRVNVPQPVAWTPAYEKLLKSDDAAVRAKTDNLAVAFGDKRILPRMRVVLADARQSIEQRQRALDLLVKGRDTEAAPALRAALNEAVLRGPALRALAAFDDAATSPAILALYMQLNDTEKRDAINTLVARPGSANKLFDAIEKGDVPRTDVHAYHVQQLLVFKDDALAKRIASVWGEIRATAKDKLELVVKHKAALTSARLKSADHSNGRRLFTKTCSACHVLFGEGGKIGPDITGSNRANLDYILENVLDPSAIVGKDYLMTVVVTTDGRIVSGLIQQETDSAVTLRTINDTVVVAKSDIDERKLSELSLMPEGQLNQLTPDEQRDLIAYLGTPNQVALRGPNAALDPRPAAAEAPSVQVRPNFVVILLDDLGWTDFGCMGSPFYETPNIDRLAAQGMKFSQAYAAAALCSPTRASLLTGKYPARLHITDFIPGRPRPHAKLAMPNWTKHLPLAEWTLAEALREAGYATACIGKWHLGDADFFPEKQGFDCAIGGTESGAAPSFFSPYRIATLPDGEPGEYLTDRESLEAVRFIEANKDRPFFLYLPHHAVHTPIQAKQELIEKYRLMATPGAPHSHATYAAMIESADQSVGRVLAKLDELHLAERTIVVVTSDNGGLLAMTKNTPLRAGKGSAYEGGVRVPLLIRAPGIVSPKATCDVPVIACDLYPTMLALAGVPPKPKQIVDGESLEPLLRQNGALRREAIFWHYPHYHGQGATPYGAIRSGDWRLIEFYDDGRLELYNISEDIGETTNLAGARPGLAESLRRKLDSWRRAVGAQMPTPNPNHDPLLDAQWDPYGKKKK